ncbi:hypothetical protein OIY81_1903 [Cryptosporidium canis]|uniref:Uncharacterized protein n=1 Tax=Cryptosporidium canis TaxID=195482 RepID=A0ABQ8P6V4_9CRYT|nr:hypothetical protein OJ252_1881 [Cryptosporidium canis]KAJ1610885.1 hypothetical protein OIY81_1903 [Cryptosporidium canis]
MLILCPEIKCLVKVYACSFFKNAAHTLKDLSGFSNISLVKINQVETGNSMIKPGAYSIYIPDHPHIKPLINEELWVSSKRLLTNERLLEKDIDLINAGTEILKLIIWCISCNRTFVSPINFFYQDISPFKVCVIAPDLLSGCVMTYPYLLEGVPVTVLLCAATETDLTECEISEGFRNLMNVICYSDLHSTTRKLLNYTRDLGFCTVIICQNVELDDEITVRLALGGISENGNIIISREIRKLGSTECSILFQKKCTLSFCDQNINPINWISSFVSNYMFIDRGYSVLDNKISNVTIGGEYITKIENSLSFILVSSDKS